MISDHVESNMTPISDFTNCDANHCPYSKLHDFGPCKSNIIFDSTGGVTCIRIYMGGEAIFD